ncbi:MAG: flippase-like domain-containing protein [Actinobacteria bacterium]|nr:flippase-like domain-containing protein [Actinomycetota bacterium]
MRRSCARSWTTYPSSTSREARWLGAAPRRPRQPQRARLPRGRAAARAAGRPHRRRQPRRPRIAVRHVRAQRAFQARDRAVELGLEAGILVAVATTFSLLLPALPASIGIFEAAALVALAPYGVDDARALSGAVVIHVLSFVPFLIAGPLALRSG